MPLTQVSSRAIEDTLRYVLGASGTDHYTFTGKGLNGAVNDPTLTLSRGHTYIFENRNSNGAHPFYIKTSIANGGTNDAYNTGVTNNGGAGGTEIVFTVPHDAPDVLYYQCSSHSSMAGQLKIAGAIADGSITQAKLANNAVTTAEINNLAVTTAKLNDAAVTTSKIADEAVTLDKLPHGDSSSNGKFLRANNGADPSFESLPASGVSVSNNADNRVVTGDGTNLNAEQNLTFDGDTLSHGKGGLTNGQKVVIQGSGNSAGDDLTINNWGNSDGDYWLIGVNLTGNSGGSHTKTTDALRHVGIILDGRMGRVIFSASETSTATKSDSHTFERDGSIKMKGSLYLDGETSSSHELEEYEEGTFTPNIQDATSGGNSHGNSGVRQGKYVKIGSTVTVMIVCRSLSNSGLNGSHQLFITNLPFRQSGVERAIAFAQVQYFNNVSNTEFGMHFQINNNETIMRFFKMKDNQGANPAVTFNHWMYSSGYYGFSTTFTYITDQ